MKTFVSAETIADAVACLREAETPLPATVAGLDDVALGRALWRMNADALAVNHDEEIEGYAAPAASDNPAQRVKSLAYLMQKCCAGDAEGDPLEQELFIALYKALWTATCKMQAPTKVHMKRSRARGLGRRHTGQERTADTTARKDGIYRWAWRLYDGDYE